ncbi:fibronectin type III domain-containing protein [Candidatus Poriferisodalis sp.]|uniref:fibronectin type III domain-containing protein n=1 Tax=Candidatus Poriferisodalis sp. TaxID=3101277 RepID=UPI003B01A225
MSVLAVGAMLLAAFPSAAGAARNWARTPGDVTAAEQAGGIEVSWSEPTEDAETVTGYRVLRRLQGVETKFTSVAEVTETTWVDTEATAPGQEYRYKVKAVRGTHVGKASRKAAVTRGVQTTLTVTPEPLATARSHINDTAQVLGEHFSVHKHNRSATYPVRLARNFTYVLEVYETGPEWAIGSVKWTAQLKDEDGNDVNIVDEYGDAIDTLDNTTGPGLSLRQTFLIPGSGTGSRDYELKVRVAQVQVVSGTGGNWPDSVEIDATA